MFDRVLFPTDGSEVSTAVLPYAVEFAAVHDATLHLLNVADTTRTSTVSLQGEVVDALEAEGERIVEAAADRVREQNRPVVTAVRQGVPDRTILSYVADTDVDLVLMPTHRRSGLERALLGSVTERVVRRAPVPVLTVHPEGDSLPECPHRRVLVPTDGSDCATAALDVGVDVARAHGAALDVLSVVDLTSLGLDVHSEVQADSLEASARDVVEAATERATAAGIEDVSGAVERGTAVHDAVLSYVTDHDVDLVVLGTHGRTGLERYLLGSVAGRVVRQSPVPVMTVRDED
ncbi:MAG: universal stress protein [Haloarculaceae archaeon]